MDSRQSPFAASIAAPLSECRIPARSRASIHLDQLILKRTFHPVCRTRRPAHPLSARQECPSLGFTHPNSGRFEPQAISIRHSITGDSIASIQPRKWQVACKFLSEQVCASEGIAQYKEK